MTAAKEIRSQIQSTTNTQKITRAMEMVAASKMRKAQDRMFVSRPYAQKIRSVISHVAKSHSEYHHPYFITREVKRVGVIVISTDRGLCGALNANLFKKTVQSLMQWEKEKVEVDLCLIGRKAEAFFKRVGSNVIAQADHLGDSPSITDIIGVVKVMLDRYDNGEIDALHIVYNEFVNTMTQKSQMAQLLPLPPAEDEKLEHHWDYIYEPESKELLDALLRRYIEMQVYQGIVENIACEQAARMVAMKSASDNAGDIIKELQLVYNKARQAAITKELSEIISGSEAV